MEQINLQILDQAPRILILNQGPQISFPPGEYVIIPIQESPIIYLTRDTELFVP